MAGITLAQAEAQLALYLAAETKILAGQKVEIDGQALTRANLESVQTGIDTWNNRVRTLSGRASGRGRSVTPNPGW
jgi:hypothetical protein